jgi:ABC-type spermidine/putrescine transport system permease subunit II
MRDRRPPSFYWLAALFALFVLFLYGPMITILAGLAYRKRFRGSNVLFYVVVASLIVPSIVVSLGIGLEFRLLDDAVKALVETFGWTYFSEHYATAMDIYTSGLGAQLTWTLPFGLLITFAIFNRFDRRFEEAARDLGATPWQSFAHVVQPIIAPSVIGIGLFGFTLSWDEVARSRQAMGDLNTLPLELEGLTTTVTNPQIYGARHRDDRRVVRRHVRSARIDPGAAPVRRSRQCGGVITPLLVTGGSVTTVPVPPASALRLKLASE